MKEFEKFIKKLSDEISHDLPGFPAQRKMAPLGRKPPEDYLNATISPKISAVLILLFPSEKTFFPRTILILRPDESRHHSSQISFPGGALDETDKDLSETALRETEEEIGIARNKISLLGKISPLYIPVSNYMVHPFLGVIKSVPEFKINSAEVKELVEVELQELFVEKNKTTTKTFIKIQNKEMEVPCFKVGGKIIWGATAMIIAELSEIIKRMR